MNPPMTPPDAPPSTATRQTLSDGDWNALEALLEKFEQAWAGSSVPELREYAAQAGAEWRTEALRELIHVDVEFRARRGEPPERARYEEWLRDYPDIETTVDSAAAKWTQAIAAVPVKIGRYEVRSRAGRGATASVYRAFDATLEREVAVKVPLAALFVTPEARARFLREARSVAQLRHPAIVAVHETGEDADGTPFIVSEFITGDSLDKVLR